MQIYLSLMSQKNPSSDSSSYDLSSPQGRMLYVRETTNAAFSSWTSPLQRQDPDTQEEKKQEMLSRIMGKLKSGKKLSAKELEVEEVEKTTCCLLTDKEEIGSVGATGMQSRFFENSVAELMDAMGEFSELSLRRCLANSSMLSSDVNAAYDPLFANAFEKNNASYFGRGVVFSKFTGSRGKSGSNDANAEYIARIRKMMDKNEVCFQTAELGKVDVGGGGTIAYILSLYGMEVIDCGVAVLNMHAPWEITSKADIYEAYKCYKVFLKEA